MKKSRLLATAIVSILCMGTASAADLSLDNIVTAAKRSGDVSRQMLHTVFGEVVNNPFNPSGDGLLNNVFFTLNEVIAILALVYLAVIGMKKIHQAGQLGSFIEHDSNGAYNIIKTTVGWLLLVPTTVGWSVAQLVFLWSGSIFGVGAANIISDKVVDEITSGNAVYVTPVVPEVASVAKQMFEMNLCAVGINQGIAQMKASGDDYESNAEMQYKTGTDSYSITITNGSSSCGSVRLPASTDTTSNYASSVYSAQVRATDTLMNSMKTAADDFNSAYFQKLQTGSGELPDVETAIQNASRTFQQSVQQAVDDSDSATSMQSEMKDTISKDGWVYLGAYYYTVATANTKMNDVARLKPLVSGITQGGDLGSVDYYRSLYNTYQTQLKNSDYTAPLGTSSGALASNIDSSSLNKAQDTSDSSSILTSIFNHPVVNLVNAISTSNYGTGDGYSDVTNPLLKMKAVGDYTMDAADTAIVSWIGINAAKSASGGFSLAGIASAAVNFVTSAKDVAVGALNGSAPIFWLVVITLLGVGMTLSIWLPFLPFIFWMTAVGDWLITLMTGVVASSLWAATHINIGQSNEDKTTYGYIFLIDVLIRPLLMVIGFIFASLAIVALGTLLNMAFKTALINVQADSFTGIFSAVAILLLYARLCTGLVARIFGLIPRMPNYVISWIGNKVNDSILGDMGEHSSTVINGVMNGMKGLMKGGNPGGPKDFNTDSPNADGIKGSTK